EFIERHAGERGAHFEASEAGGFGSVFTGFEEKRAEAAAGPIGVDGEGADFSGVGGGSQKLTVTGGGRGTADKSFASAPGAACGYDGFSSGVGRFDDEIGLVGDELRIEAEDSAEGAFDLSGSVVVGLKDADGRFDEGAERRNVGVGGRSDVECCRKSGHRFID